MNVHKFLVVLFSDGCNDIKSSESKIRVNKMYAILALLRGLNDKEARAQDLKNFGPQKQIIENTTPLKYYDFKNLKKIRRYGVLETLLQILQKNLLKKF